MVLHNITNNAELIKITATSLSAKWLLESDLHIIDVVAVPCCVEELVAEPQDEDVLDHLLSKVVVNSEDFILVPVWCKGGLQISGAAKILAEWLLDLAQLSVHRVRSFASGETHDNTSDAVLWVAVLLQLLRDNREDTWWQCHVENTVVLLSSLFQLIEVLAQGDKGLILVILTRDVCADFQEVLELALDLLGWSLDRGLNSLQELLVVHLSSRIADDLDVLRQELVAELVL